MSNISHTFESHCHAHRFSIIVLKQSQEIPSALKKELRKEIYQPILQTHHVFRYLVEINAEAVTAICFTLMSELACRPSQDIFVDGEEAECAIYVVSGCFIYYHNHDTIKCEHSSWLAEACLWCKWFHAGCMQAETAMELVCLSSGKFGDMIMQRSPNKSKSLRLIRTYARLFVDAASKIGKDDEFDNLTDLPMDQDTLTSMADAAYFETEAKGLHRKGGGLLEGYRSSIRRSAMAAPVNLNLWSFWRKSAPLDSRSSTGTHASGKPAPPATAESPLTTADEHMDTSFVDGSVDEDSGQQCNRT